MKKVQLLALLILFSSAASFAQKKTETEKVTAPKSAFIIQIDGKEYTVTEGEELKVGNSAISVKLSPFRTFDNGFLSFNYPSNFSFDYETSLAYKNWSLDGNDFVVLIFEIGIKTSLDLFVGEMVDQFGKQNCRIEKKEMILGGKKLLGKRINVTIAGQKMIMDFMEIDTSDSKSRFIAFQDVIDDDGNPSEESGKTFEVINQSVKFK